MTNGEGIHLPDVELNLYPVIQLKQDYGSVLEHVKQGDKQVGVHSKSFDNVKLGEHYKHPA